MSPQIHSSMTLRRFLSANLAIAALWGGPALSLEAGDAATAFPGSETVPVLDLDSLSDTSLVDPPAQAGEPVEAPAVEEAASAPDTSSSSAQGGMASEKGLVLSAENGKPVAGALIMLAGDGDRRISAQSDKDGLYSLAAIAPGRYRMKVGKKGFSLLEMEQVEFKSGRAPFREIKLEKSVLKGALIEAKGGSNQGTAASMMAARRSSKGVMEGVGAEQIAKSTDSDAGAVAKRITGTSLVGGKYIYVRGLGERYTNMTLNGLPVPSPEKDKRVVPQDLFPASALDRFVLYKTFTPELYGDFAGGSVALETKGIPEKKFAKVSIGAGGTDFKGDGKFLNFGHDRLVYHGGNTFLGFDDGTRSLPDWFPKQIPKIGDDLVPSYRAAGLGAYTKEDRAGFLSEFPNHYSLDTGRVNPNQNYSISLGGLRNTGEDSKAGYILSLGFKNKYNQKNKDVALIGSQVAKNKVTRFSPFLGREETFTEPIYDTSRTQAKTEDGRDTLLTAIKPVNYLVPAILRRSETGIYEATISGLANLGWDLNADHKIFWRNFYANIGTDEASFTHSISNPDAGGAINQDKPVEERYLLEFSRRSLFSSQLGGGHYLGRGLVDSVGWTGGYSWTQGEVPDSRKYLYSRQSDTAATFENVNNDVWGTRIYELLDETALAGRVDALLSVPPDWSARDTFLTDGRWLSRIRLPEARVGGAANFRRRQFDVTRYTYDADRNVYIDTRLEEIRETNSLQAKIEQGVTGFDFNTSPKAYDSYQAREGAFAGYLTTGTGLSLASLPLDFEAGLRMEGYLLDLHAPYTGQDLGLNLQAIEDSARDVETRQIVWLPSLGLTAHPYANGKLHLHYANTVTRPEFREIAPFQFTEYLTGRDVRGNTALRETRIRHWDLRWEWFFPSQQLLSLSLFDKDFDSPIEMIVDVDRCQTWKNARGAFVRGVELEGNLAMETLWGSGADILKGWTLYGNIALMRSRVELDTSAGETGCSDGQLTSSSRPLVGQSPYLFNLKLNHTGEWRRVEILNALLFNVSGERIKEVGVAGAPDIYEQPFPSLEYLGKLTLWKNVEVAWTVKNLLNRAKKYRGYEFNQNEPYHSVDPQVIREIYAKLPSSHYTEISEEGTSYELKIGYGL